jgi:hypothetical protein
MEHACIDENRTLAQELHMLKKHKNLVWDHTLINDKSPGSFMEGHCDNSLISVSFYILDFSTTSSTNMGLTYK